MRSTRALAVCAVTLPSLAACGLTVPKMQPFATDDARTEGLAASALADFIRCELHLAVQDVIRIDRDSQKNSKDDPVMYPPSPSVSWLTSWGAAVSLKVIVDEKSILSPGLSFKSPMESVVSSFRSGSSATSAQSFSFGLGFTVSSEATRSENMSFFYPFADLLAEPDITKAMCMGGPSRTINADLRIDEFLRSKYVGASIGGLMLHRKPVAPGAIVSPYETLTYENQFIVVQSANATPTWNLVHIAANPTGTLLNFARSRTDDVLITFGEVVKDEKTQALSPSPITQLQLQANLIGQAVATALRNSE